VWEWEDAWVPTLVPGHADWIGRTIAAGEDGDDICDEVDNCPEEDNPLQANSNLEAEEAWGAFER
jgi:hypothetical protein